MALVWSPRTEKCVASSLLPLPHRLHLSHPRPQSPGWIDGQGWYYKDQCMQGSWRQQQGLEEICLPGLCSPGAFDPEQQAFDPEQLAFDAHTYEFLDTCPDGTEPLPLSENQTVALLTRCLDTAEQGLLRGTDGYAHCPT